MSGFCPDTPKRQGQQQEQKQIPFGDDNQKNSGDDNQKAVRLLVGFGGGESLLDAGAGRAAEDVVAVQSGV
jgi:hypothetical protein